MKTKLEKWLLVKLVLTVVLLAFMVFVNMSQGRTIQAQKAELVKQIKTTIASQVEQVQMMRVMEDQQRALEEAARICKLK